MCVRCVSGMCCTVLPCAMYVYCSPYPWTPPATLQHTATNSTCNTQLCKCRNAPRQHISKTLQHTATHCHELHRLQVECEEVCCSVLQSVANMLPWCVVTPTHLRVASGVRRSVLQCVAVCCQRVAVVCCNTYTPTYMQVCRCCAAPRIRSHVFVSSLTRLCESKYTHVW